MLAAFVVVDAWTSVINELSLINGDSCRMGDNRVKGVLMVVVSSSVHRSLSVRGTEEPSGNVQKH